MCKSAKIRNFCDSKVWGFAFKINFNIFVGDNFIGHLKFIII